MAMKKPTTIKKQLSEKMKDTSMKKVRVLGGTAQAGLPKTTKDMQKYSSMARSSASKKVTLSGTPKPKSTSYLGNVAKEVKQTAKSASNAVDKYLNGNRPLPKGIKIGPSNVKAEAGQLAGAVLQGRRYDAKGKQITATPKSKGAAIAKKAAMPKPTPVKLPTVKSKSGPKGSRTETMKSTRVLGGTGYAKGSRLEKGMRRSQNISGNSKKTK